MKGMQGGAGRRVTDWSEGEVGSQVPLSIPDALILVSH